VVLHSSHATHIVSNITYLLTCLTNSINTAQDQHSVTLTGRIKTHRHYCSTHTLHYMRVNLN